MSRIARSGAKIAALCAFVTSAAAHTNDSHPIPPGARYVAMGSSFAAGSGIAPFDPQAPTRCQRSTDNYAHQLARTRELNLVDVTCGGATTAHILGRWSELPPQVDALTHDTALVTITVGGNDVGYIGNLIAGSCGISAIAAVALPVCQRVLAGRGSSARAPTPNEEGWQKLEAGLAGMLQEVRRRSPKARIVVIDYLTVLPDRALCAQTPLSSEVAATSRTTAARLARITADVARSNGVELLPASRLSLKDHDACSPRPWITGIIPTAGSQSFTPYHPNREGMTAIAKALDRHLGR